MRNIRKIFAVWLSALLLLLSGCLPEADPVTQAPVHNFTEAETESSAPVPASSVSFTEEDVPASTVSEETQPAAEQTAAPSKQETEQQTEKQTEKQTEEALSVKEDGKYTSLEEVALYIHLFGHLPSNYLTKNEAEALGWVAREGNLWKVAPGAAIGGNRFGNYEGRLPDKNGRKWYECDVNYEGGFRGEERVLYSNDGLVYYTSDHYNTFTLLYGEE